MPANDIESDAAQWLIRLERDPSLQTRATFEAWLATDPRHQAAFVRMKEIWTRTDILKRLRPLDGAVDDEVVDKFGTQAPIFDTLQPRPNRRVALLLLVASLLIVAGGGVWLALGRWGWESYQTGFGAFQRVVLADGSTVMLNTDSRIRARIGAARREIVLEKGEVLFTVAHDVRRPFDVAAGDTVVRAVGTAFSVRLKDQKQVDVLVAKGRVAINPDTLADKLPQQTAPSAMSMLTAGEMLSVIAHRPMKVQKIADEEVTRRLAWTQGRIWFDRVTLAEAIAEFNRYNHRRLVIDDPSIAGLRIGGAFDNTDLDSFVAALETFGIRVVAEPGEGGSKPGVIRLSRAAATAPH